MMPAGDPEGSVRLAVDVSQFLLERFEDGGVLLALESGSLFRLNRTATLVWARTLALHDAEAVAQELAATFEVPADVARRDVAAALSLPADPCVPAAPPRGVTTDPELLYETHPGGCRFSMNGVLAMAVDVAAESLCVFPGISPGDYGICLRAIAPKLVARTGPSVLHAAAVRDSRGRVTAFLGVNGAGKTTTARTFAANGFELICEDKLVTHAAGDHAEAVLGAETKINQWIGKTREELTAHPDRPCSLRALAQCSVGPSSPLADILLVDSERRAGGAIELHRLPPSEAATEIFQHAFYGASLAQDWRRQLSCLATLARTARVFRATMPDGLPELVVAVRRYKETTAS